MENRVKTLPLVEAPIAYTLIGSFCLHFFLVLLYGTLLTPKKSDPRPVPQKFKIEMVKRQPVPEKIIKIKEKKIKKAKEVIAVKMKETPAFSPAKKMINKTIAVPPVPSRIREKPKANPPLTQSSVKTYQHVQTNISVPALNPIARKIKRQETRQNPVVKVETSRAKKAKPADFSPLPRPVENVLSSPQPLGKSGRFRKSTAGFARSFSNSKPMAAAAVSAEPSMASKAIRRNLRPLVRDLPQAQRTAPANTSNVSLVNAVNYKKDRPLDFNPADFKEMNPVTPRLKSGILSGKAQEIYMARATVAANLPGPRQVPVVVVDPGILKGYLGKLQVMIAAAKQYPEAARKSGQEGKVTVQFTVLKNGDVKDIELVSKTNYPELDQEALAAVKRAAPFSELPDEIGKSFLEIVLPFKFKLNE